MKVFYLPVREMTDGSCHTTYIQDIACNILLLELYNCTYVELIGQISKEKMENFPGQ